LARPSPSPSSFSRALPLQFPARCHALPPARSYFPRVLAPAPLLIRLLHRTPAPSRRRCSAPSRPRRSSAPSSSRAPPRHEPAAASPVNGSSANGRGEWIRRRDSSLSSVLSSVCAINGRF
jgi:hypothetical protein